MNEDSKTVQWLQLLVLAGVHFVADMFGNVLPVVLPVLRDEFSMSLTVGGIAVAMFLLTSNLVQMVTGHTREKKTVPVLLYVGLLTGAVLCSVPLLPKNSAGIWMMVGLAGLSGAGIAMVHPEGLRAVHRLENIPSSISTAVFMVGGYVGFAFGGTISAAAVSKWDLKGLWLIALFPAAAVLLAILARLRMAVETAAEVEAVDSMEPPAYAHKSVPFWPIMGVAIPAGISTTTLSMLLPTHLEELGFALTWGGYSSTVFGLGAATGSLLLAFAARRWDEMKLVVVSLFIAGPLTLTYLMLTRFSAAIILLFGCGFTAMGSFILLITLARHAKGPNLGRRMGFIIGGTWGVSVVAFMALTPVADRIGTQPVLLRFAVPGYLVSALAALWLMARTAKRPC